ncbi:peptidase M24, structural domain-containing protein [Dipodascopsis tothii]|uniref:peptidase M24, structural domain-containing protein n=1 Tax=Dipodascopsis tothii TaxID=44089 RepID=UPI0034CE76FB
MTRTGAETLLETAKYPAKAHAQRTQALVEQLEAAGEGGSHGTAGVYFLRAAKKVYWPFCDQEQPFRQNRYFHYLTGCETADAYVVYTPATDRLVLYLPPVDADDVMWSGMPETLAEALAHYDVDAVKYADELAADLAGAGVVRVVEDTLPEAEPVLAELDAEVVVGGVLVDALDEARAFKDDYELALLRKAAAVSDAAHLKVLQTLRLPGHVSNETHVHAEFVYHSMRAGSKHQAYDPICCAGPSCSTLHYVRNDQDLRAADGALKQLILLDAGAEWHTYAADITRTFPVSGVWTPEAREVYELVLAMQLACIDRAAPGVLWDDLHALCHRMIVRAFLAWGLFVGGTEDEIFASRLSAAFLPHGLGHMLGMDTHDPAGHANYDDPDPMFRYLRIRRTLQPRMVVTIEPGCYFNPFLIQPYLDDPATARFVDTAVLERYWAVGGVRIEDDVVITDTGCDVYSTVPKHPDELSKIILAAEA